VGALVLNNPGGGPTATTDGKPAYSFDCQAYWRAALLVVVPLLPFIAIISSVSLYLAPSSSFLSRTALVVLAENPLTSGVLLACILALLGATGFYFFRGTSADHANVRSYAELTQRMWAAQVRQSSVCATSATSQLERAACQEVQVRLGSLREELQKPGMRWILGSGYIGMWTLIHRAEEAMIQVEPWEEVVRGAEYDRLRLQGSSIGGTAQPRLLQQLQDAVDAIHSLRSNSHATALLSPPATDPTLPPIPESEARATLRELRQVINEFRDDQWDALVRTRNHLLAALTLSGVVTFLLLALAINGLVGNDPRTIPALLTDPIAAASAFYLVGATVGLFNRLNDLEASASDVEDYGLTMARLMLTPVLSGLAAVGGALLIAMVPAAFNPDILAPQPGIVVTATPAPAATETPAPTPAAGQTPAAAPAAAARSVLPPPATLAGIFSLQQYAFGLVLAAIFGLTPSLLLGSIRQAGESYKTDIRNSEAG
jgi:hypothetical protein